MVTRPPAPQTEPTTERGRTNAQRTQPPVRRASGIDTWAGRVTQAVATEVRRWRKARNLSTKDLSDRTYELGYRVPGAVITNLENSRREAISVAELLVLAAALDVAPAQLLAPVGYVDQVEPLPGINVSPWLTRGWIVGATILRYVSFSFERWRDARTATGLYDLHRQLVREHDQIRRRIATVLESHAPTELHDAEEAAAHLSLSRQMLDRLAAELAYSLDRLRSHRKLIVDQGLKLPDLSPELLAAIDQAEPAGRHHAVPRPKEKASAVLDPDSLASIWRSHLHSDLVSTSALVFDSMADRYPNLEQR